MKTIPSRWICPFTYLRRLSFGRRLLGGKRLFQLVRMSGPRSSTCLSASKWSPRWLPVVTCREHHRAWWPHFSLHLLKRGYKWQLSILTTTWGKELIALHICPAHRRRVVFRRWFHYRVIRSHSRFDMQLCMLGEPVSPGFLVAGRDLLLDAVVAECWQLAQWHGVSCPCLLWRLTWDRRCDVSAMVRPLAPLLSAQSCYGLLKLNLRGIKHAREFTAISRLQHLQLLVHRSII